VFTQQCFDTQQYFELKTPRIPPPSNERMCFINLFPRSFGFRISDRHSINSARRARSIRPATRSTLGHVRNASSCASISRAAGAIPIALPPSITVIHRKQCSGDRRDLECNRGAQCQPLFPRSRTEAPDQVRAHEQPRVHRCRRSDAAQVAAR